MNVVFRTDASITIGSGHIMRCLSLANQLKRHSVNVTFICRDEEGNYIDFVKDQGINVKSFSISENESINSNFIKDANETIKIVEAIGDVALLIVDHYELDVKWENILRPFVKKLAVIDDLANRKHDCDLLLDQNLVNNFEKRYDDLVSLKCIKLLGPKYVLLRDEFLNMAPRKRLYNVNNILIFFGGSDHQGVTLKALEAVKELDSINVDVVVGSSNPRKGEIEQVCNMFPHITYHCQIDYMAKLMNKADLFIGAGGSITWERCALGLPALTVSIAENQVETAKLLHKIGAAIYLGENEEVSAEKIKSKTIQLLNDVNEIKSLSEKSKQIVDLNNLKKLPVLQEVLKLLGES